MKQIFILFALIFCLTNISAGFEAIDNIENQIGDIENQAENENQQYKKLRLIYSVGKDSKKDEYYKTLIQALGVPYSKLGLAYSVITNKTDALKLFMEAGFSPDTKVMNVPLLFLGIYKNTPECVSILLEKGADPETSIAPMYVAVKSLNALSYAIEKDNLKITQELIKYGADVNKPWNNIAPVDRAIKNKQADILKLLLNSNAEPTKKTKKLINKSKDEAIKELAF